MAAVKRFEDPASNRDAVPKPPRARPGTIVAAVLAAVLDLYHISLAPFLSAHSGSACRFEPSCSRYAKTAILRFGIWRGGYLAIRRLARCNPFGGHGYDPVPQLPMPSGAQGVPWTHDS